MCVCVSFISDTRHIYSKFTIKFSGIANLFIFSYLSHDLFLSVTSAEISEDSSLLSAGASDSIVRIWSLNTSKLKAMKPASELEHVDKEAGI